MSIGAFMIGCIPDIIPVKPSNPDESLDTTKSVEDAKEIVASVKKKGRKSNRAKKTDETE